MMRPFLYFLTCAWLLSCGQTETIEESADNLPQTTEEIDSHEEENQNEIPTEPLNESAEFHLETFENAENSWGYRVMRGDQTFINQPHIPAIPGKYGFQNQEEAEKVGQLVIQKLDSGEMPPSVTRKELDSLSIFYPNAN
jgi:hypothetical protein